MTDAKTYLQQIKLYDTHINNKLEEKARLKAMALNITSTIKGDVVGGSHSQDKIGDAISRIVDLEKEIDELTDKLVDAKEEATEMLSKIQNKKHRTILRKRYLEYWSWNKIAAEIEYTYRGTIKAHGKALQTLEKVMKTCV